jgi:hypothetical protein
MVQRYGRYGRYGRYDDFQEARSAIQGYRMADRFADRPMRAEQYRHTHLTDVPYGYARQERIWDRMKGALAGRGPKGYRRSDERIREDVCDLMVAHPDLDASDIEVEVKDSEVILSGTVDDRWSKRLAEDLADDVSGVRDVHNRLRVRPEGNMPSTPMNALHVHGRH